ncbi:MAG: hypothetical protein OXN97_13830 [Bryobacterales bacterium]|nr:hypothetical protein [Bryobacterales bacterium]MDE0625435.1 hypothetical protein [Bryobacterales bacterium]
MAPTIEKAPHRTFKLQLKSSGPVAVRADTICEPNGSPDQYVLKRGGEVVGKFDHREVLGWWIAEDSGSSE